MADLTMEKWQELNARLEDERSGLRETLAAKSRKLTRIGFLGLGLVMAGGAAMVVGSHLGFDNYVLFGTPAGLLVAVDVFFILRIQRRMALIRSDIDRVNMDIRQWKKKKPGSIFDRQKRAK